MQIFLFISLVLIGICLFLHLGMRIWLYTGWRKALKMEEVTDMSRPISVIIAAKDEEANLKRFLPYILKQQYPDYEVIVVLDRCQDESLAVVEAFQQQFPKLRSLSIKQTPIGWAPKKWAIHQGVQASKFGLLAFTDADCEVGKYWLQELAKAAKAPTEIILGIGKYFTYPEGLNRFIRFETLYVAFQYIGSAAQGFPYMGVGRNMAYSKQLYDRVGGMESFKSSLSGDDDLFVNAFGNRQNVRVVLTTESHTYSEPERRFGSWVRQKVRHLSASANYSLRSKIFLASFHLSQMALYALWGLFLSLGGNIWLILTIYIIYLTISWYIFGKISGLTGEKKLFAYFPLLDGAFVVYNLCMVPLGLTTTPKWKI